MQVEHENFVIAEEIERMRLTPGYVAAGLALKIAERAYEELEEQGITQSRLAELMEVSRSHVSSLLTAPTNMTLLTFAKVSLALGLLPDVLMTPIGSSSSPKPQPSEFEDYIVGITADDDVGARWRIESSERQTANATT